MDSAVHRYPPGCMPLGDHDAPLFHPPPQSSGFLKKFQSTENKGFMSHNYRHFTNTRALSALPQTPGIPSAWQRSLTILKPSRQHLCANATNRSRHTAYEAQPVYLVRSSGAFRRLSIAPLYLPASALPDVTAAKLYRRARSSPQIELETPHAVEGKRFR